MNKILLSLVLSAVLLSSPQPALAHAGKTDAQGCHTNHQTGEYHCHPERQPNKIPTPVFTNPAPAINLDLPKGTVRSVGDGDTVRIDPEGLSSSVTVRLAFIDAPERSQPQGQDAKQRLQELVLNKTVEVRVLTVDKYGRSVAELFLNKKSINLALVSEGQAVVYRAFLKDCLNKEEYFAAEEEAKKQGLGLWKEPNPVMPWNYRRNLNKNQNVSKAY